MTLDLTLVWALIIVVAVFIYVVLDGFDLGIGILFNSIEVGHDRDTAMNSIAPVWDGNETWLAFTGGSLLAAFSQGIMLGALLQGVAVSGRAYSGGWWDWLTPFSLLTGASVVVAYALLGSTWLVMKAEGALQLRARAMAWWLGGASLAAIVAVSIATLFLNADYFGNWLHWPNILWVSPVPILVALASLAFVHSLNTDHETAPFLLSLGIFLLCFIGLVISVFPDVVPGAVTIWDAATDRSSQVFMLWGTAVVLPMILAYTAWSYWVFRGKVDADGYHA